MTSLTKKELIKRINSFTNLLYHSDVERLVNQLEPTISEIHEHCVISNCTKCAFYSHEACAVMCPIGWNITEITKAIRGNND